ncbi:hypothetical protein FLL45_18135 [Aliikangiella marina]|uniref:Heme biosynthesis operon protein HemX n=1 Tax=Aliikangiella marina TaxID=1712262 RepID=A0A545T4I8_9GAMM|nr:uroporphyrinogen-III C-methyltransferase [Aliikangiella marina]TQV72140.1 hypothetical protein FLL45_18135 [Aliikangiella marina]
MSDDPKDSSKPTEDQSKGQSQHRDSNQTDSKHSPHGESTDQVHSTDASSLKPDSKKKQTDNSTVDSQTPEAVNRKNSDDHSGKPSNIKNINTKNDKDDNEIDKNNHSNSGNESIMKLSDEKPAEEKTQQPIFDNKSMPKMETHRPSKKRPIYSIVAIILALLTLGGVGWAAYQQFLMQQNWQELQTKINNQVTQQLAANQESAQIAKSSLATANQNQQIVNQQQQLIQQLRDSLTITQERLKDLSGRRHQDWLLAEAEYLIKLAEFKITLEGDKRTAIGLLKAADEKVKDIGDNSLIELRQSIAQDIANLQLVIAPDISGIAVQLDAISGQIPSLSLIALEFKPVEEKQSAEGENRESLSWSNFYQQFLDDFVTIKDHSEPRMPLMTLEQRGLLNANLQLALQQSQVAVLRSEPGLYLTKIDNAIEWIETFFQKDELATNLLAELNTLRDTNIVMDLPKSLDSRKQIERINQDRLYQWLDATQPIDANEEQPQ